ncbi:MAG: hypothetical protein ACM33T_06065 [Solirubrobacterales bacterium]
MLPKDFPFMDVENALPFSKALLVVRPNEMHGQRGTIPCMIEPITTEQINDGLGARVSHGFPSMFSRLGFTEPNGAPIRMTSHQFRHWLNTLAHRGGLSQLDIAKWSGRKDVRQNQAYDHMTSDELLAMVRTLSDDDERLFGSLAELTSKAPMSRDEFLALEFPTAHITPYGFCIHDYTMLPCQTHRDCINCNEHVCVKGDRQKTARIKAQLELALEQQRNAQNAIGEDYFGADRWFEHHTATVNRLQSLVDILEDVDVPEGSIIRLANPDQFSSIEMAVRQRSLTASS